MFTLLLWYRLDVFVLSLGRTVFGPRRLHLLLFLGFGLAAGLFFGPLLPAQAQTAASKDITPFTNDYSGHVYWVSMRVWDLLPASVQPYWPRFLQLSAGVSLNRWEEYPDSDAYLSTHISVDVDWREIIPRESWIGRTMGDLLNRYHLPAPALQITPRPGVRLLFVGQ